MKGPSRVLEEIRIKSLGVIESSTLELGPGLTVITGETGAGKTMVVTALGLLLGGRADSGAVRTGDTHARVEGVVAVQHLPGLADQVEEAGGAVEDGEVVLARNVAAEGRSRAWVGGAAVPVASLAQVAEPLVAVHGQSDQHRLLQPGRQRGVIDRFGGERVAALLENWRADHTALGEVEKELIDVRDNAQARAREADQLRFALDEIEAVDPQPGEDLDLAGEESRLGHAEELRTAADQAHEALSSDAGGPDASATLGAARAHLDGVRAHDSDAAALADRAAELGYLVADLAADVASYAASLETDPSRLAHVSERRSALLGLTRKYGDSVEEVLAWAKESAQRLLGLDDTDARIDELQARRTELRDRLAVTAAALSEARQASGERLAAQVQAELAGLAMPHARIEVSVTRTEVPDPGEDPPTTALLVDGTWVRASRHGVDDVEILLAANKGSAARALGKGASGGELSRVMLALEVALAGTGDVPTFVFDEVDAGVGGKAAVEIGRRLAALARTSQVLVVTHLPQVAAYGDRHVVVHKDHDGSVTTSGLVTLDEDQRERELSRMLAGVEDSESARAHARELLEAAAPERACLPK
ncbi:MAG: DNA repair protein RecN [Nocardioides sp.]|uniref:DNA repair protein RecN n=1 Tax=Nocardioides sp. TaxID=35761 RepID=UPI003F12568E